jgi:hypothetical protein
MVLTEEVRHHLIETAQSLKGSDRRLFMARTVKLLGPGGQRRAERELSWNRHTIRKGMHELNSGIVCVDAFGQRGRSRAEERLPRLLDDIEAIVDAQSQADPRFRAQRLYTRLSAAVVRRQLIELKGYSPDEVPAIRTISDKLNQLGYHPAKVAECRPKKGSRSRDRSMREAQSQEGGGSSQIGEKPLNGLVAALPGSGQQGSQAIDTEWLVGREPAKDDLALSGREEQAAAGLMMQGGLPPGSPVNRSGNPQRQADSPRHALGGNRGGTTPTVFPGFRLGRAFLRAHDGFSLHQTTSAVSSHPRDNLLDSCLQP